MDAPLQDVWVVGSIDFAACTVELPGALAEGFDIFLGLVAGFVNKLGTF